MTAPEVASTFRRSAIWLSGILLVASPIAIVALASTGAASWQQQTCIALASILVSVLALVPGMLLPPVADRGPQRRRAENRAGLFVIGCAAASAIRAVCTVALVVMAGYQFSPLIGNEATVRFLSLSIGFWYVLATSVEVTLLARSGRRLDRKFEPPSSLVF